MQNTVIFGVEILRKLTVYAGFRGIPITIYGILYSII